MASTSTKPYLLRALYEWCVDNGFTPYVAVVVDTRTQVPRAFVKDNQIVLNLGPEAVQQLVMGNDFITCSARFGGVGQNVSVPIERVAAIYARENGQGMAFEVEDDPAAGQGAADEPVAAADLGETGEPPVAESEEAADGTKPGRPHLTRVK